jgi:hypothetical protein
MKLSTKIILPIILISALLILLTGCFGVPADESPGYTPGTITGIIAAPCCSTSAEPVSETCCIAPEYWCYYCQETWSLQDGVEVVLTYGEDEVATTTTNENGEFTFTDVSPGKNYVITAYCPDFDDNRPLVKDVALEVASTFDTKITDLVSTSLGLVVDFLVVYTEWGPEDISLDDVIANKPNFYAFPKFKKLVLEVRRVLENCGNIDADADVQDALCKAAEEISGLDIGCDPGYTPPSPPTPDPCEGNTEPNNVSLDNLSVVVGQTYSGTVSATDDGIKDPLTYSWTAGFTPPGDMTITSAGVITWNPICEDICDDCGPKVRVENGGYIIEPCTPNIIKVTVNDGCATVGAEFCIKVINTPPALFGIAGQVIADMEVAFGCNYTRNLVVLDPEVTAGYQTITFNLVGAPASMSIIDNAGKPAIYWAPVCDDVDGSISVILEVSDGCATVEYPFTATATNDPPKLFGAAGQVIQDMVVACTCTYERNLVVLDADVPDCQTIEFTLKDAPPNMSIVDGSPSKISWTPNCEEVLHGIYEDVTLEVSDGCAIVSYMFNATAVNDEPEFTSPAPITLDLGNEYVYDIVVEDVDVCPDGCQTLAFALIGGPAGMVIAKTSDCEAQLTWTPGCEDLEWTQVCEGGDCQDLYKSIVHVKIEVDDGCCNPVYKEFDITVYSSNIPPEIDESYILENIPVEICNGSTYCFELKATDDDGDNLNWELIETNAGGIVYFSDDEGMSASLCWEPANCGPVMEKGTIELSPELCTRYFIVRVYDDGCPELYDEFCFYITVRDCPPLDLYEKDPGDWSIVGDGAWGQLEYNRSGSTFNFVFSAEDLNVSTNYSLIYYADPWPGNNPGALIGTFTSDGSGNIASTSGSVDLGIDLPDSADANHPAGAKIWLVLSDDYNSGAASTGPMTGWNPTEYLFENNLITFDDIDVP